jgi:hypothetical protein
MQNSWHRLSLVRDEGTDLIVGGETAARPGIAGVPNDLDLTAGADDDQQSHRCQEIAARARRSGILRPRPGATLPPAPQSSQDFDVCCLAARDRSRTRSATPDGSARWASGGIDRADHFLSTPRSVTQARLPHSAQTRQRRCGRESCSPRAPVSRDCWSSGHENPSREAPSGPVRTVG